MRPPDRRATAEPAIVHLPRAPSHCPTRALAALSALLELADPAVHRELDELEHQARRTPHPHLRWLVLTRRTTLMIARGDLEQAGALMDEERQLGHQLEEPDTENVAGAHWVSCEIWQRGLVHTWLYICSLPEVGPQHPAAPALGDCLCYASQGDDAAAGTVLRSGWNPSSIRHPPGEGSGPTAWKRRSRP